MKEYQRVVEEKKDLDTKLEELDGFIEGDPEFEKVDGEEKVRLRKQRTFMQNYSEILGERIAAFPKEEGK